MNRFASLAIAALLPLFAAAAPYPADDPPPAWAFVIPSHEGDPAPTGMVTAPGSTLKISAKGLDDAFNAPDWFPQDHPPMPDVVAHGDVKSKLWACGLCHLPVGVGAPESAVIAGLPAAYIEQQFAEFHSGRRSCPVQKDLPCYSDMPLEAQRASADEIKAAAAYFAGLHYRSRIHVVETATAPTTRINHFDLAAAKDGSTEPIGARIIEISDDETLADINDWHSGITAYVPPGSIARGRQLVETGAGAAPCASCHGAHFQGIGMTPPLAGRSPTYIFRQLYDIQYGYRRGPAIAPMQPEVAHLTLKDRIAIAAYLASLTP